MKLGLVVLSAIIIIQSVTILRQHQAIAAKDADVKRLNQIVHVYGVELGKDDNQISAMKKELREKP